MWVAVWKMAAGRLSPGSVLLWPLWWPSVTVVWSAAVPFSASRGRLLISLPVGKILPTMWILSTCLPESFSESRSPRWNKAAQRREIGSGPRPRGANAIGHAH